MKATTSSRLTAEERREEVLRAAVEEFARRGLDGTSTEAIAQRAGISQPYLFRLFHTKKELFIDAVGLCFQRTLGAFQQAAQGREGDDALKAMGAAYGGLLKDRTLLLLQLQAYVACDDNDVQAFVRKGFRKLHDFVQEASGASADEIRDFFAKGMLMNVVAAMQLDTLRQTWARDLMVETDR